MELEKQVCSLESAKRLKELGVKQESLFYWSNPSLSEWEVIYYEDKIKLEEDFITGRYHLISAFTVAELGELLPYYNSISFYQWDEPEKSGYGCHFSNPVIKPEYFTTAKTEAEARAFMLIYLLENNLLKLNGAQREVARTAVEDPIT